jgi:hypothetical protein
MKPHPVIDGLLKLKDRTGVLFLERDDALFALFHLENGRLLKATGLIAIAPEVSSEDPRRLLKHELNHLKRVEKQEGWHPAWLLVAEQLSLSLSALRSIPGKKRLRFVSETPPEEVRRYGAGYPLREDILRLFFAEKQERQVGDGGGEEWEDFISW